MKPFRSMLFSFHACVCVCAWKYDWLVKLYVGENVCDLCLLFGTRGKMLSRGGLWHASLVRRFHQQKSIPLYSAARSACLYWVEIGWTSFMLHAFACRMNAISWRPVGPPSVHLHCFYAPAPSEPICGHSPFCFLIRVCAHEKYETQKKA